MYCLPSNSRERSIVSVMKMDKVTVYVLCVIVCAPFTRKHQPRLQMPHDNG